MSVFAKIEKSIVDSSCFEKKNLINVKKFLIEKFQEQPDLEWIEIAPYEENPNYPDVICKFGYQKESDDFESLSEDTLIWIDYLNNDLAGYLQGYENIFNYSVGKITRKELIV